MRLKGLFLTILLMSLGVTTVHGATTSYDYTFVANDVFSSDFHTRLNANFTKSLTGGINNISTANIVDDTLTEADFADEINPRIRTYEAASCEKVVSGLLPTVDADLTNDISAGTAYPRGYRVIKASATAHTYTASKWTFVDIDINGDFQYSEVAIGSATPSVATNSIRLARVSSDSSAIITVSDLRTTSCTAGPFENISDAQGEATLEDLLTNGKMVRTTTPVGTAPQGFAQGLNIVYDAGGTSFTVKAGGAYINGKYRISSVDTTVPITADDPTQGISGIDSGAVAANTKYYVYGVADMDSVKTMSFSFSTSSSAPAGVTNSRLLGSIKTEGNTRFVSRDVNTVHAIDENEIITSAFRFDGTAAVISSQDTLNVSGITDNGTGNYTVAFDVDYASATTPKVVCGSRYDSGTTTIRWNTVGTVTASAVTVLDYNSGVALADSDYIACQVTGDTVQ